MGAAYLAPYQATIASAFSFYLLCDDRRAVMTRTTAVIAHVININRIAVEDNIVEENVFARSAYLSNAYTRRDAAMMNDDKLMLQQASFIHLVADLDRPPTINDLLAHEHWRFVIL